MHELNFVRDQKVHQASLDVQWGFVEDIEEDAQKSIEDRLNRMLRLQADLQLRAGRYQRSLERLDYRRVIGRERCSSRRGSTSSGSRGPGRWPFTSRCLIATRGCGSGLV